MQRFYRYCSKAFNVATLTIPLMVSGLNTQAAVLSAPIFNPTNGHTYFLLDTATWTSSESEANTLGGHLVTINNAVENDWVYDTFVPLLPTGNDIYAIIWLGYNDAAQEGTFVWTDSSPTTYTNWVPGQPDNSHGGQHYAFMYTPSSIPQLPSAFRQWDDHTNDAYTFGVNAFGLVEVVPEPSTWLLFGFGGLCLCVVLTYKRDATGSVEESDA